MEPKLNWHGKPDLSGVDAAYEHAKNMTYQATVDPNSKLGDGKDVDPDEIGEITYWTTLAEAAIEAEKRGHW